MSAPGKYAVCFIAVLLAGCAGPPYRNLGQVPDWESPASRRSANSSASIAAAPPSVAPSKTISNGTAPLLRAPSASPGNGRKWPQGGSEWIALDRWARETGAAVCSQLTSGATPAYCLRSERGTLSLRVGSLLADWDGLEVRLGFAPQEFGHQPFVHARDLDKTIHPLLEPGGLDLSGTIVIDPGHGGTDSGARSVLGGENEKDYTLDWALRLRMLLEAQGRRVVLTRVSDADLAPSNRVAYATAHHAALFVSLHFNSAAPDHAEAGLETYCLTPFGLPSSLTRGYADDASQTFPNNAFDSTNLELAVRVHRSLLQAIGQQDRGVRRARFPAVLRGQQCPAVLIEGGYLSNEREARLIADPSHREKLAEAVARALQRGANDK